MPGRKLVVFAAVMLVVGVAMIPFNLMFVGDGPFWLRVLVAFALSYGWFMVLLGFPFVLTMGYRKLRMQRRHEIDQLGDENVVYSDPDGERKLHDFLTAITSMEARIGLLQRSAPYLPPEKRPPPGLKPPRARLTPTGWSLFSSVLIVGLIAGMVLGWLHGVDATLGMDSLRGFQPVGLMRLLIAGLLGVLAVMPVAIIVAAFFAEVKEPDDAGADRPEPA